MSRAGWRFVGLVVGFLAGPPAAESAQGRGDVLAVLGAGANSYELSIDSCARTSGSAGGERRCPMRVSLLRAGKAVDSKRLPQLSCAAAHPVPPDVGFGADREAKAWLSESDRCVAGLAARLVELAPEVTALLLTQRAGFEHTHRTHWLYLARGRTLQAIWTGEEQAGPSYSTTTVLASETPRHNDVAFIEVFMPDAVESVTARRVHYDLPSGRILETRLPDERSPLYLLHAGSFATSSEAERAWSEGEACFEGYGLMSAGLFPGLQLGPYFLGTVFAREEDAKAAIVDPAKCPRSPKPSIVRFSSSK
jgi:hypothetical protein